MAQGGKRHDGKQVAALVDAITALAGRTDRRVQRRKFPSEHRLQATIDVQGLLARNEASQQLALGEKLGGIRTGIRYQLAARDRTAPGTKDQIMKDPLHAIVMAIGLLLVSSTARGQGDANDPSKLMHHAIDALVEDAVVWPKVPAMSLALLKQAGGVSEVIATKEEVAAAKHEVARLRLLSPGVDLLSLLFDDGKATVERDASRAPIQRGTRLLIEIYRGKVSVADTELTLLLADKREDQLTLHRKSLRFRMSLAEAQACYAADALWLTDGGWEKMRTIVLESVRRCRRMQFAVQGPSPAGVAMPMPVRLAALCREIDGKADAPASIVPDKNEHRPVRFIDAPSPRNILGILKGDRSTMAPWTLRNALIKEDSGDIVIYGDRAGRPRGGTGTLYGLTLAMGETWVPYDANYSAVCVVSFKDRATVSWFDARGRAIRPVMFSLGDETYKVVFFDPTLGAYVEVHPRAGEKYARWINFVELAWKLKMDLGKLGMPAARSGPTTGPASGPAREAATHRANAILLDLGNKVSMELMRIPAGRFVMGSAATERSRYKNETQQEVKISKPFLMGVYEVTQEQWKVVMEGNPSRFQGDDLPVDSVSWEDAVSFCQKVSAKTGKVVRLPTEAEWEYACRAGTQTRFNFGDNDAGLGDYAWYRGNSDDKTHPVGGKKPNAFGLYDMNGNAIEWCSDWYVDTHADAKSTDPTGPGSGSDRVLRGGGWYDIPGMCRSASRTRLAPRYRDDFNGFRVVVAVGGTD